MVARFEWQAEKDQANQTKHGVGFGEAVYVFTDENGVLISDPDESGTEDRFLLIGVSVRLRILIVCHCYRGPDSAVRLISARKATRAERLEYEEKLP